MEPGEESVVVTVLVNDGNQSKGKCVGKEKKHTCDHSYKKQI